MTPESPGGDTVRSATQPNPVDARHRTKADGKLRRWRLFRPTKRPASDSTSRRDAGGPAPVLDTIDWKRWYPALIWFAAGVVAVTFALSYHGLFEFAYKIVGLPVGLAVLVPVGVDVFSLCCLAATFLLRDAPWRVRAYSWLMFSTTVAVSVAGNAVYAAWFIRRPDAATALEGWRFLPGAAIVGASLWPAFSAGALHLLIVARRHMERMRDRARQAVADADQAAIDEQLLRARAIELAAGGVTASAITDQLRLDDSKRRTVERWTEPIRSALATARPAVPAKVATRRPVNGRRASEAISNPPPAEKG